MREGRDDNKMREIEIQIAFTRNAEGSALISFGDTRVLCNATVEERVPFFVKEKGEQYGWVTGEYSMLPRSTIVRTPRERSRTGGRTQEIQRLIGRSLRSVVDLSTMGARTIILDCDVLQADGGTRTAAISGAFVAMVLAMQGLRDSGRIQRIPVFQYVAAVSVGKYCGKYLLDLDYREDSRAEVDMNVVMTDDGKFIELQGTGEAYPFENNDLIRLLELAKAGITAVVAKQKEVLGL